MCEYQLNNSAKLNFVSICLIKQTRGMPVDGQKTQPMQECLPLMRVWVSC